MKKIFRFLIDFHADYFNLKLYLAVAFFIASLIAFNYTLDFEDSVIDCCLFIFLNPKACSLPGAFG
jgi:hypothetical protein